MKNRSLLLVVVAAAILRFFPISFGLPYLLARPDEEVATGIALRMARTGDLNPHFFHWPSLVFYVFAAAYAAISACRKLLMLDPAIGAQEAIIVGRTLVASAGTATVVVLYRLARRTTDSQTALLAAMMLAVAVLHVRDSHFAMTDVLMTLLLTMALSAFARALDENDERRSLLWFALAGLCGGLATSTKYSAAAVLAAPIVLLAARTSRSFLARHAWLPFFAFGAAFGAAFLATTPYAVLNPLAFQEGFVFNMNHLAHGQMIDLGRGWWYHATYSLPYSLGPVVYIAALAGSYRLASSGVKGVTLVFCGILFYILISSGRLVFFRYLLPLLPIMCLSAAVAVREFSAAVAKRTGIGYRLVLLTVAVFALSPGIVNSVWLDVLLARSDSRVLASEWLTNRIRPEHSVIDVGSRYVALDLSPAQFRRVQFDETTNSFAPVATNPDWVVLYDSPLFTFTPAPPAIVDLVQRKYALVATVGATHGTSPFAIYDLQDAFFLPLSGFWIVERPGPTVYVYRRTDD